MKMGVLNTTKIKVDESSLNCTNNVMVETKKFGCTITFVANFTTVARQKELYSLIGV